MTSKPYLCGPYGGPLRSTCSKAQRKCWELNCDGELSSERCIVARESSEHDGARESSELERYGSVQHRVEGTEWGSVMTARRFSWPSGHQLCLLAKDLRCA